MRRTANKPTDDRPPRSCVVVSVNRGLVGPTRQFGPSGIYNYFMYAMLLGALAPIPFWLWQRRFPDTRLKFINLPVLLNGPTLAPPASGINYTSWIIVGFIFRAYRLIWCIEIFFARVDGCARFGD